MAADAGVQAKLPTDADLQTYESEDGYLDPKSARKKRTLKARQTPLPREVLSRPDVLKDNVKSFFDEAKGNVDQGLSRIFTILSLYGTLCTFTFGFLYTNHLFDHKSCCLPQTSWSANPDKCCAQIEGLDILPTCCQSPRVSSQIVDCRVPKGSSVMGVNGSALELICKQSGEELRLRINGSTQTGMEAMPEILSLFGNCTVNPLSRTYQQLASGITSILSTFGLTLLVFASVQGQLIAWSRMKMDIYRSYLSGDGIRGLRLQFLNVRRSPKRRCSLVCSPWNWHFYFQLYVRTWNYTPMPLLFLFVVLSILSILGVSWATNDESFCQLKAPAGSAIVYSLLFPLGEFALSLSFSAFANVNEQWAEFSKLQHGLTELVIKAQRDIEKGSGDSVLRDIGYSMRMLAGRPNPDDDIGPLGRRPSDRVIPTQQDASTQLHRQEGQDIISPPPEPSSLVSDIVVEVQVRRATQMEIEEDEDDEDGRLIRRPRQQRDSQGTMGGEIELTRRDDPQVWPTATNRAETESDLVDAALLDTHSEPSLQQDGHTTLNQGPSLQETVRSLAQFWRLRSRSRMDHKRLD